MIKQLLKYQAEDSKIFKIKTEMLSSTEWKNYSQAKTYLDKAPEKLAALETHAIELRKLFEVLKKKCEELAEMLSEYDNVNELVDGGGDIAFYKKSATQLFEKLKSLKIEINKLSAKIKAADSEYQELKANVISTQNKFAELSKAYTEYQKLKKVEIDQIEQVLKELEKEIPHDVLKKYQAKRSERILPIICAVKSDRCSKCGMELTIAGKEKLSAINKPNAGANDLLECDNCHRILYKE